MACTIVLGVRRTRTIWSVPAEMAPSSCGMSTVQRGTHWGATTSTQLKSTQWIGTSSTSTTSAQDHGMSLSNCGIPHVQSLWQHSGSTSLVYTAQYGRRITPIYWHQPRVTWPSNCGMFAPPLRLRPSLPTTMRFLRVTGISTTNSR